MENDGYKPIIKKDNESEESEIVFDFHDEVILQNKEWKGMPECKSDDLEPWKQVIVSFKNREAMEQFSKLIGQKVIFTTPSIWFPKNEVVEVKNMRYVDEDSEW